MTVEKVCAPKEDFKSINARYRSNNPACRLILGFNAPCLSLRFPQLSYSQQSRAGSSHISPFYLLCTIASKLEQCCLMVGGGTWIQSTVQIVDGNMLCFIWKSQDWPVASKPQQSVKTSKRSITDTWFGELGYNPQSKLWTALCYAMIWKPQDRPVAPKPQESVKTK